jgi:micrococcal nuclease
MLEALALCLASIHDGDSFRLCDGTRVRLTAASGPFDAPEYPDSPPCRDSRSVTRVCDRERANASRDYLAAMLRRPAVLHCVEYDRYERRLCRVTVGGVDVADAMVRAGHGRIVEGWR